MDLPVSISEISYSAGLSKRNTRIFYYCLLVILHYYMYSRIRHSLPHSNFLLDLCFLNNISFYLNLIYYSYVLIMHVPYGNKLKNFKFLQAYFKFCYAISFLVFILYWLKIFMDPLFTDNNIYKVDVENLENGIFNQTSQVNQTIGVLQTPEMRLRITVTPLPMFIDLFLHGANFVINFIEHVYVFPKSDSKHIGIVVYFIFTFAYALLIQTINYLYGVAIYPLLSHVKIIEFFAVIGFAMILVYIGDCSYRFFIKKQMEQQVQSEMKSEKKHM
jgi:hypothetical protein